MNKSPLAAATEEDSVFGNSSCRPPGDGQEYDCPAGEHGRYQKSQSGLPTKGLDHCSGSYNCSCKHQVCSKMKRTEVSENFPEAEVSKHALSSCLQWAKDLHKLLDDTQGLELFQRYLASENFNHHTLDFWLAIRGLKNCTYDQAHLGKVIKAIYKRYIKASVVRVDTRTKQEIGHLICNKKQLNAEVFDKARLELEETVLHAPYTNFLKSDLYLQYLQRMQNGPAADDSCRQSESSGSNSSTGSRDMLDIMPTVPEESELNMDYKRYLGAPVLSVPKDPYKHRLSSGNQTNALRFSYNTPYTSVSKTRYSNSPYAKYSSYLPPSAQDSDRQSLSSGAHTDDAMSVSDFDTPMRLSSKTSGSYEHSMRKNFHVNNENNELQPIIPRTHRIPASGSVSEATKNPHVFAAKLIVKLSALEQRSKSDEKLNGALSQVEVGDEANSNNLKRFEGIPQQLLNATIQEKLSSTNESDQMILDQHVSRVWNDSLHQSPINLTPGQYSPPLRTRSPTMDNPRLHPLPTLNHGPLNLISTSSRHRSGDGHISSQYTSRSSSYSHHRHRKERDTCSTDSGTVQDFVPDRSQPGFVDHAHRYYHQSQLENQNEQVSGNRRIREGSSNSRKSSQKKVFSGDSASSCFDSGVSVCDPIQPEIREKVSSWLSDEKYSCSQGPNSEKDSSTHYKKSSHSSLSNSSGNQSKQSKKQSYSIRSGPVDHSVCGNAGWTGSGQIPAGQQMQQQQHYELPNSGGYPQPHVTAQLVEAMKRLEEETARNKQLSVVRTKKTNKRSSNNGQGGATSSCDRPPLAGSSGPSAASSLMGGSNTSTSLELTTVCYSFSGELIPYLTKLPGKNITLKQFKTVITKRGNFRYFFKSSELESKMVQEVTDDNAFVPLWEGKISCTIEPCPDP